MSYQAFARIVGLPATSLERWEKGLSGIKASQLKVLAEATSVSTDWLLGLSDENARNERAEKSEGKLQELKENIAALLKQF